jgi:hypothetical protein
MLAGLKIKATTAIGRAKTKVKGINADFPTSASRARLVFLGISAQRVLWRLRTAIRALCQSNRRSYLRANKSETAKAESTESNEALLLAALCTGM